MTTKQIVAVAAVRTAIGSFGGALRDVAAYDLGAAVIGAALARAQISAEKIDQVIYANCRQPGNGPNPSRTAAIRAGIPTRVPAFTVNMACPSGIKTVMLAARELANGEVKFVVAGGIESMSTMPSAIEFVATEYSVAPKRNLPDQIRMIALMSTSRPRRKKFVLHELVSMKPMERV